MSKFVNIAQTKLSESNDKQHATKIFAQSCNLCAMHNRYDDCGTCAIKTHYDLTIAIFSDLEQFDAQKKVEKGQVI